MALPPSGLIAALRPLPVDNLEQLLLGATLFKICLAVLGAFLMLLASLPVPPFERAPGHRFVQRETKLIPVALSGILCAAILVRIYALDTGLWLDEVITYVTYMRMSFGESITTYDSQNQHFVYSLLAHASTMIFGESIWASRLPAVLFGVGSIWMLYFVGREVSNAREALFSAGVLAVSYHHIWYSQTARGYTGLLFWTLLASWCLLRALREPRPKIWLLYAASSALGVYTHMTMLFVIVGHFLIYVTTLVARRDERAPGRWIGLFFGFGLASLLTLQLHALVLPQFFAGTFQEESVVPAWKEPLWMLLEIVRGLEVSFAGGLIGFAALLVFGAGLASYSRTNVAVLGLLIAPVVGLAIVVIGLGHHVWPRFFFFAMGFAVLVVVRGAMVCGEFVGGLLNLPRSRSTLLGTSMCIGLILLSALSVPLTYRPKQDYWGAMSFVQANQEPGDVVVTAGLAAFPYSGLYQTGWQKVESADDLQLVRSQASRTWLVYTLPDHLRSVYPDIVETIQRDFVLIRRFDGSLNGGAVFVYRSGTA